MEDDLLDDWRKADREMPRPPPYVYVEPKRNLLETFADWSFDSGLLGATVGVIVVLIGSVIVTFLIVASIILPFYLMHRASTPAISLRLDEFACTAGRPGHDADGEPITICDRWERR